MRSAPEIGWNLNKISSVDIVSTGMVEMMCIVTEQMERNDVQITQMPTVDEQRSSNP
jgi:hypothetical protein